MPVRNKYQGNEKSVLLRSPNVITMLSQVAALAYRRSDWAMEYLCPGPEDRVFGSATWPRLLMK